MVVTHNNLPEALEKALNELEALKELIKSVKFVPRAPDEVIFDVDEASDFLGLARQTLYQLCSERKIPFMKRGKKLYFSKTELMGWLKEGRCKTYEELMQAC